MTDFRPFGSRSIEAGLINFYLAKEIEHRRTRGNEREREEKRGDELSLMNCEWNLVIDRPIAIKGRKIDMERMKQINKTKNVKTNHIWRSLVRGTEGDTNTATRQHISCGFGIIVVCLVSRL
jgi:hypothetical protein